MTRQKIRLATLLAVAAAGLAMLSTEPAVAAATPTAPTVADAPLLAMVHAGENPLTGSHPLCDETGTAIGVDAAGHAILESYTAYSEGGCAPSPSKPVQVTSGWGDVTQVFAEPDTTAHPNSATVFTINTQGELTVFTLTFGSANPTLGPGTVIGTDWNAFAHVTYAGNGVFYAVDGDGNLLWYRYLGVSGNVAVWADSGSGAVIGTGWQDFPLVFASAGDVYASTDDGSLLWYQYSDPTSDAGTWSADSGATVGSGWDTVLTATADAGLPGNGHVLIHTVGQDGDVHFYDHLDAGVGGDTWSQDSGTAVLTGWTS